MKIIYTENKIEKDTNKKIENMHYSSFFSKMNRIKYGIIFKDKKIHESIKEIISMKWKKYGCQR